MGLFATQTALKSLQDRLGELETAVRTLKTANKHLELEWEELYDKVRRQMSRMSKRYAVDVRENEQPPEPEITGPGGHRVDSISEGILRRRAGNGAEQ